MTTKKGPRSKEEREWHLDLPWGKVAMISWGDSSAPPVLLVHGYMDNAGTFALLVDKLPDDYYYVSFDLPGHGKSDPFPLGPLLNVGDLVETTRRVVLKLGWKRFIYIGHSMGYIIGAIYSRVYPQQLRRLVALDPQPPLSTQYFSNHMPLWYHSRYTKYYDGFDNSTSEETKKYYTRDQTLAHVMKTRNLTAEQARPLLARSLQPVGNGVYKLSFEKNARLVTSMPVTLSTFLQIVTSHPIPTLMLHATDSILPPPTKKATCQFMADLRENLPQLQEVYIQGGHDIHLTNAEDCARSIVDFIKKDFRNKKAKL